MLIQLCICSLISLSFEAAQMKRQQGFKLKQPPRLSIQTPITVFARWDRCAGASSAGLRIFLGGEVIFFGRTDFW